MFGGDMTAPKKPPLRRRQPVKPDILYPSTMVPGEYAHIGRDPNTNYQERYLHYKQKVDHEMKGDMAKERTFQQHDAVKIKYDAHAARQFFRQDLENGVKAKMDKYEETIENRRTKLRELLDVEEREFYREVVDKALRGGETRLEENKRRVQELTEMRERERQQLLKEKRQQQFFERCMDIRPVLFKKNLIETKNAQLQQMRENEAKREAEREMEKMWYDLMIKEVKAKAEREEQEVVERHLIENENITTLNMQVKGKELMKEEERRTKQEDLMEMEKLLDQLRREEIEGLDEKRRKRDKVDKELREQLAQQEHFLRIRKEEERALDNAFAYLNKLELDKLESTVTDKKKVARKELDLYMNNLKQLEVERKEEDRLLNKLLVEHRESVEKKQAEARCKVILAKRELQKNVMAGRAEQLAYKRMEAEERLKQQQAENELLRMNWAMNERLEAENARLLLEAQKQYGEDLKKQIAYNQELQRREREELERQIEVGKQEEQKFKELAERLQYESKTENAKHPFRKVLELYNCYCQNGEIPENKVSIIG